MKESTFNNNKVALTPNYSFDYRKGSILSKEGAEFFLEPRLKDFISVLLEQKNDVVTRDELLEGAWKDSVVNDESLTKAAYDFRKFIAKNNIKGIQLVTIRNLGYKLVLNNTISKESDSHKRLKILAKVIGYIVLALIGLIVIIRAVNY